MPCFSPIKGYRGFNGIVFKRKLSPFGQFAEVPCGQCIGCRMDKSREWAVRCVHEAKMHQDNCFITLTYNDAHLPADGSLKKEHWQAFMKRLRFHTGKPIRYFHCGEYGPKLSRPHYHACLFGFDFDDKEVFKVNAQGDVLYTSELLDRAWQHQGYCTVGSLTWESAAYVARYILKKHTGSAHNVYYESDPETGEITGNRKEPEYATMSRRPGIGKAFYEKYGHTDVFPHDFVVHDGKKFKTPRFYDYCLSQTDQELLDVIKKKRKENALKHKDNNTPERLWVREQVQKLKARSLKRGLEDNAA